jgi:hypothetical protein
MSVVFLLLLMYMYHNQFIYRSFLFFCSFRLCSFVPARRKRALVYVNGTATDFIEFSEPGALVRDLIRFTRSCSHFPKTLYIFVTIKDENRQLASFPVVVCGMFC